MAPPEDESLARPDPTEPSRRPAAATHMPVRVAVTGATGLIGARVIAALRERGDEPRGVVRSAERARRKLPADEVELVEWDPLSGPAPAAALASANAVVHLAGEPLAQRWTAATKERIHDSRVIGTANLVAGIAALGEEERPAVLVCASGAGYYGPRHPDDELDESAPPGSDFLGRLCVAWEEAAQGAAAHGLRVVSLRTGVVLSRSGGALAQMLTPFRLGVGGPIAGGSQPLAWIHQDDVVGMYRAAIDDPAWSGPINAVAPEPVSNRAFTRALGAALHRPAILPLPGFALRARYGEMADMLTTGQRAVPARAQELGFRFEHPRIEEALRAALASE